MKLPRFFLARKDKQFVNQIKKAFGFIPSELSYYKLALTHKSVGVKNANNERLEFLGDSVLSTVISDYLYLAYPDANEGDLSKMRSRIVKRETVNKFSFVSGLDKMILLNEKRGISKHKSPDIFGNAFEAFIGAIYLDKGYDFSKVFLVEKFLKHHFDLEEIASTEENFIGRLLEYSQKKDKELIFETSKNLVNGVIQFTTLAKLDNEILGEATSNKKKFSEQMSARDALERMQVLKA